jgi:hypothetical protein
MTTRRLVLKLAGAAFASAVLPLRAATLSEAARKALEHSHLVYLTPLKRDGSESRCHAEVWFVFDGHDVFVVTAAKAWRRRAIANGLNRARLWVGEFGNWQRANGKYRQAPELLAVATTVDDKAEQARVLDLYGDKYRLEWIVWGPRFKNGLADGSRVMLRYSPTSGAASTGPTATSVN